jgi:5-methylcytosine-specific restriction endonuclease McrA
MSVLKRDNYTCISCRIKGGWNKELKKDIKLEVDHIKSFSEYPELRFDTNNGRTLCRDCHQKTENYAGKTRKQKSNPNVN